MKTSLRTLILVLAGLLPCLAQPDGRPVQQYEGAARIGNLDHVTVVYPAAAGGRGEIQRDSARLRASYLEQRYGVRTSIAADDAVSAEQRAGHLLLIGWDNALLGTEQAPHPYQRKDGRLRFLGLDVGGSDDALLFMAPSPYNPDSYLAFWSRIDPEFDRFLAFPFLGSDWAVYHDWFIVAQGMFEDGARWPPERNTYAEHTAPHYAMPIVGNSEHYRLHAKPGDLDETTVNAILAARERALQGAVKLLGGDLDEGYDVDLFVYRDVAEKHELSGVADAVHSFALRGELHMPLAYARADNPHEEIHLLAARRYGACYLTALYEGLAIYLEYSGREEELVAYAALLHERNSVPPVALLLDNERLRRLSGEGIGFAPAALLVRWIDSEGGREALGQVYGARASNAPKELERLLGDGSGADADALFRAWVAEQAAGAEEALALRKAMARASERGQVGDFAGRAAALAEALRIRPGNPRMLYQMALAQFEAGLYDEAQTTLEGLIESSPADPTYLVAYCHYQLGRVHEYSGRLDAARAEYQRVLALPDEYESHSRAREALAGLDEGP